MQISKVIAAILVLAAFAGGVYIGKGSDVATVITNSQTGASYSGGYDKTKDQQNTSAKKPQSLLEKKMAKPML